MAALGRAVEGRELDKTKLGNPQAFPFYHPTISTLSLAVSQQKQHFAHRDTWIALLHSINLTTRAIRNATDAAKHDLEQRWLRSKQIHAGIY